MSDAFEQLMSQRENQDSQSSSQSTGGRPMSGYWSGYKKITVNNRIAAKCNFCTRTITNTAKVRLINHR